MVRGALQNIYSHTSLLIKNFKFDFDRSSLDIRLLMRIFRIQKRGDEHAQRITLYIIIIIIILYTLVHIHVRSLYIVAIYIYTYYTVGG